MKFAFIDEFKPTVKDRTNQIYGLTLVLIDSVYYSNYKEGFENEFSRLGWSKERELKGRHVYSKKVFEGIAIDKRISFSEELFRLSSSGSGKRKRIFVYVCFDSFKKDEDEAKIYTDLLCRIFRKIGPPINKKQDKNLIAFFLDSNDQMTRKIEEIEFYKIISEKLHKNWVIFEKPLFIHSSNLLPGIIFADFVSYFHQNFIDTRRFLNQTIERFSGLLDKDETKISPEEKKELGKYIINFHKHSKSRRIINILKGVVYVK